MDSALPPIGPLFPLGGPVPEDLIIGRAGEIDDVARRLREGLSTLLVGPRRIGKTTVCEAVCRMLAEQGVLVIKVDVPERDDCGPLLQQIVDGCASLTVEATAKSLLRLLRPTVERILEDQGVAMDLSALSAEQRQGSTRKILELPIAVAQGESRPVLLFFDELQRVVDYDDGGQVLADLIDLYAGSRHAVVLVDGSDERTFREMLGAPSHFGKLVDRLDLPGTIPAASWRAPLTERFKTAGLRLDEEHRDRLILWGENRPYETMAVARYTAFAARKTDSDTVTEFDVQMGIDEARRHLADDGA
jgi:ABC-type Mn2+/Zn2+ transport system ATPase subunit